MPTIGLSMIVKDGGESLRCCLSSVRPLVDQIVIADTGSTDHSIAIARDFDATVVPFRWVDDFAAARNAALVPMTTDWILSLDADEEALPASLSEIRRLVDQNQDVGGYNLPVRCYIHNRSVLFEGSSTHENHDDAERARLAPFYFEFLALRLFRRHPRIFYNGCVHEMVVDQIQTLGMRVERTEARIRNYGRLWDIETRDNKQVFYRRLGLRKVAEEPDNFDAWYTLGLSEFHAGDNREALRCMEKALVLSHQVLPLYFIAQCLQREGRLEGALTILAHIGDAGDLGLQKNLNQGDILHDLGRLTESGCAYNRALEECDKDPALDVWRSALESRLGFVQVRLGDHQAGLERLRHAVAATPDMLELHERLVKGCIAAGADADAADAAEATLNHFVAEKLFARAVALRLHLRQPQQAQKLAEAGLHLFPGSASLRAMQIQTQPARTSQQKTERGT